MQKNILVCDVCGSEEPDETILKLRWAYDRVRDPAGGWVTLECASDLCPNCLRRFAFHLVRRLGPEYRRLPGKALQEWLAEGARP